MTRLLRFVALLLVACRPPVPAPTPDTSAPATATPAAPTPCPLTIPQAPDPVPAGFDYAPLAQDWCDQLAACGFSDPDCVQTYLAAVANPPTGTPTPPSGATVEEGRGVEKLVCEQSLQGIADPSICLEGGEQEGEAPREQPE